MQYDSEVFPDVTKIIPFWLVVWNMFYFSIQLGISSSQLTKSYFSEGSVETTNQHLFIGGVNPPHRWLSHGWLFPVG
jgi:hypothetical protein